jgi:hypothetical protein
MPTKEDLLHSLTTKQLRQLAKKNGVKLVGENWIIGTYSVSLKKEIIEVLLESPKITKKKILNMTKALTKKAVLTKEAKPLEKPKPKAPEVKQVLRRIRRFKPHKKPRKERELEAMLVSYLGAFYPDIRTQMTYERARIDVQIGKIGIEIKYQPSSFDRLYGQIDKYLRHLDYVIAVVGYEKSPETTRFFKKRLKERGWLNSKVFVLTI